MFTGPSTRASKPLCSVPSMRVKWSNVSKLTYKEWLPKINNSVQIWFPQYLSGLDFIILLFILKICDS